MNFKIITIRNLVKIYNENTVYSEYAKEELVNRGIPFYIKKIDKNKNIIVLKKEQNSNNCKITTITGDTNIIFLTKNKINFILKNLLILGIKKIEIERYFESNLFINI